MACCVVVNGSIHQKEQVMERFGALTVDTSRRVIAALKPWMRPDRLQRLYEVAGQRRTDVELVLENISDDHNAVRTWLNSHAARIVCANLSRFVFIRLQ